MSNKIGICFEDAPVGAVLGRLDMNGTRRRSDGARYLVINSKLFGSTEEMKTLVNLNNFGVVATRTDTYNAWKKIPFEILDATLTIKDPLFEPPTTESLFSGEF